MEREIGGVRDIWRISPGTNLFLFHYRGSFYLSLCIVIFILRWSYDAIAVEIIVDIFCSSSVHPYVISLCLFKSLFKTVAGTNSSNNRYFIEKLIPRKNGCEWRTMAIKLTAVTRLGCPHCYMRYLTISHEALPATNERILYGQIPMNCLKYMPNISLVQTK